MAAGSVKLSIYSTFKDDGTKKAERAIKSFTKTYGELNKETGKFELTDAQRSLAELSTEFDRNAAQWQNYADKIAAVGANVTKYISAPATAVAVASTKLASDYEDSFAKVTTIMDKQAVPVEKLKQDILDLSTATGKEATELSEATYQALSASVETSKVVGFVEDAAKLAKAGFTDTATSVDTLTTIMNAYKLSADEANAISDKLVQTQNDGKTTVGELGASLGSIIPTAAALNVNLDNVMTSYALMTKQGIKTTDATTALKNTLSELSDGGSTVAGILKEKTGKTFGELMNEGASLGDVISILYEHVDGNSEAFKNLWGNMRAGTGALAIANSGAAGFTEELSKMQGATGNVSAALEDLQTPSARANKALNAVKNTGIELGQEFLGALAPALDGAAKAAQGIYKDFTAMGEGEKQAAAEAIAMGAAAGPAIMGVSKIAGGIGAVNSKLGDYAAKLATSRGASSGAAKAMGVLSKMLSGPGVLGFTAVVGVAALAAKAIYDTQKRAEDLKNAQQGLISAIESGSPSVANATSDMSAFAQSMQRTKVDVEGVITAQAELSKSIQERNANAQSDIDVLESAQDVIHRYMNKTGLAASEQGELRAAVELVNDKCGTQYQVIDAVNGVLADEEGKVLKTVDALDDYINKKQESIRVDALSADLEDLYKQRKDDIAAVASATDQYKKALEGLQAMEKAGDTGTQEYLEAAANVDTLWESLQNARGTLDACEQSISSVNTQLGETATAAQTGQDTLGSLAAKSDYLTSSLGGLSFESFRNDLELTGVSVESFKKLNDEQLMTLGQSYDGTVDSIIASLKDLGVELPAEAQKGGDAAAAAIEGASGKQAAAAEKAKAAILAVFASLKPESQTAGGESATAFSTAIAGKAPATRIAAQSLATAAQAMKVSGTFSWGAELAGNFVSGIESKISAARTASSNLASAAADPIRHSIPKVGPLHNRGKGEKEWGEHAVRNFAEGIRNGAGYVEAASNAAARAAARGFAVVPAGSGYAPVMAASRSSMSLDDMRRLAGMIGQAVAAEMPQGGNSIGSIEAVPGSRLDQAVESLFAEAERKSRM